MSRGPAAIGAAVGLLLGAGIIIGAVVAERLVDAAVAVLRWAPPRWWE